MGITINGAAIRFGGKEYEFTTATPSSYSGIVKKTLVNSGVSLATFTLGPVACLAAGAGCLVVFAAAALATAGALTGSALACAGVGLTTLLATPVIATKDVVHHTYRVLSDRSEGKAV